MLRKKLRKYVVQLLAMSFCTMEGRYDVSSILFYLNSQAAFCCKLLFYKLRLTKSNIIT